MALHLMMHACVEPYRRWHGLLLAQAVLYLSLGGAMVVMAPAANAAARNPDQSLGYELPLPSLQGNRARINLLTLMYYRGINTLTPVRETQPPVERLQTAGLLAAMRLRYRLSSDVTSNVKLIGLLESGSTRSLFYNRTPMNNLFFDNAEINYRPTYAVSLSAGALNQGFLEAPLLVKDSPFPALQQSFRFEPDSESSWHLQLVLQEATPTSQSLGSTNERDEPFAKFFTQTLFLSTPLPALSPALQTRSHATHFDWSDLTASIAADSRLGGNTTTTNPPPNTRFIYHYQGFELGSDVTVKISNRLSATSGVSYLINTTAPNGQNKGRVLFVETTHRLPGEKELSFRGESFVNQADSSPGAFNAGQLPLDYGHNNREGFTLQTKLRFVRDAYAIRALYIDSRLLDPNPFQQDSQTLFANFEAFYDLL